MSTHHRHPLRRSILLTALGLFMILIPGLAHAKILAYQEHPGVWRTIDTSVPRPALQATDRITLQSTNITWNVVYQDPSGAGFNASKNAAAKTTLMAVLGYINTIISYPGVTLDVTVNASINDFTDPTLAFAGTYFDTGPNGFSNGVAYDHLSTGVDPYPGTGQGNEDLMCTVNFAYNWNLTTNDPTSNQYDLYSVLVHEFTHGLGLISLSASNGTSSISGGNPGVFTVWDSFLKTGTGVTLWTSGGRWAGKTSDLTGGRGGVFFTGAKAKEAFGGNAPVYTPNPWSDGSSMGHWDSGITGGAIMEPSLGTGVKKRTYFPVDLGAMKDIGLTVGATPTPTPTPTVQFGAAAAAGPESNTSVSIPVILSAASQSTVSVTYAVIGGTAVNGSGKDYNLVTPGTVTFTPGVTSQNITLPVINNNIYDANRDVVLGLAMPVNAGVGPQSIYDYTIQNDDAAPAVTVYQPSAVAESAGTVKLTVALVGNATVLPVTVNYATSNGTARAGIDYQAASGTLTFTPPESSKTFNVPLIANPAATGNQTFTVTLSSPSGATLGQSQVAVTIIDDVHKNSAHGWQFYE